MRRRRPPLPGLLHDYLRQQELGGIIPRACYCSAGGYCQRGAILCWAILCGAGANARFMVHANHMVCSMV